MSKKQQNDSDIDTANQTPEDSAVIVDAEVIEPEPVAPQKKASGGFSGLALALAVIAILLTLAGAGYGYQTWQGLQARLQAMQDEMGKTNSGQTELSQKITDTRGAFDTQAKELDAQKLALVEQDQKLLKERENFKQQGAELTATLEKVYQRVGRNSTEWMASEAEYLMRVANHRLRLERDVSTAAKALETADGRLRDTGDPGWIEVRKLIADEVAVLKGVGGLDRAGVSATLSGLIKQVKGLKMVGLQYTPERPEDPKLTDQDKRSFETLLADGWKGFKSVMVIRHRNKPVTAMLAPEQQFFVYQNIELQLEAARLAMLRGDQVLFDNSLKMTAQWLTDFFDNEANTTTALVGEVEKLKKLDVNPALPDISKSLMALRARLKAAKQESAQ